MGSNHITFKFAIVILLLRSGVTVLSEPLVFHRILKSSKSIPSANANALEAVVITAPTPNPILMETPTPIDVSNIRTPFPVSVNGNTAAPSENSIKPSAPTTVVKPKTRSPSARPVNTPTHIYVTNIQTHFPVSVKDNTAAPSEKSIKTSAPVTIVEPKTKSPSARLVNAKKSSRSPSISLLLMIQTGNPMQQKNLKVSSMPVRVSTDTPETKSPSTLTVKTKKNTRNPSSSPSLMFQLSHVILDVVMKFDDCRKLGNSSLQVWYEVTTSFVRSAMTINLKASGTAFSDLEILIGYKNQITHHDGNSTRKASAYPNQRSLQTHVLSPLDLFFDVAIKLRSTDNEHDFMSYFSDTLNIKSKLVAYLKELSSYGDDAFGTINNVTVEIGGYNIARPKSISFPSTQLPSFKVALLIGVVVAVFFIIAITAFWFVYFKKKLGLSDIEQPTNDDATGLKVLSRSDEVYIAVQHASDDVSTLSGIWTLRSKKKYDDPTAGESSIKCTKTYQNYVHGIGENRDSSSNKEELFFKNNKNSVDVTATPSSEGCLTVAEVFPEPNTSSEPNIA